MSELQSNHIESNEYARNINKYGDHEKICTQLLEGYVTQIEDIDVVRPELLGKHQDKVDLVTMLNDNNDTKIVNTAKHMDEAEKIRLSAEGKILEGIFKPLIGENTFFSRKTSIIEHYKRERSAYLVDRWLGFGLVPPTIIRTIDEKIGSLQLYIEPSIADSHELMTDEVDYEKESSSLDWIRITLFDFIIANIDRSTNNWLVNKSDNAILYAIDNGSSFCTGVVDEYEMNGPRNQMTVDNSTGKKKTTPIPAELIDLLRTALAKSADIQEQLMPLLREHEIDAMLDRVKLLIESGKAL